jgi:tetratricopeptide (TPR) repeat protein
VAETFLARLKAASSHAAAGHHAAAAQTWQSLYTDATHHAAALDQLQERLLLREAMACYESIPNLQLPAEIASRALNDLAYCHSLLGEVEIATKYFARAFAMQPNMATDDEAFHRSYNLGLAKTHTPESRRRRPRFHNLLKLFDSTAALDGDIAECGCFRGLSSYLLCARLRDIRPEFTGHGYLIFDSFQGLSIPTPHDQAPVSVEGNFAASEAAVRSNLREFPDIEFHPGWLPGTLEALPERRYRFVHIDVDLYEPTLGALRYFYPRLVAGGCIVSDDYNWHGAKRAVHEVAELFAIKVWTTKTLQACIFKP